MGVLSQSCALYPTAHKMVGAGAGEPHNGECPDGGRPPTGIGVPQYGLSEPVERGAPAMSITMIGLDTAKSVFQLHAVNESGKVEIRRKLQRDTS